MTLEFNGFEDGEGGCSFNGWVDGGADARHITNGWNNVRSGNCALRLQDNTGTSTATSGTFNVADYSTLKVDFFFKTNRNMGTVQDGTSPMQDGEYFHLDICSNGGDSGDCSNNGDFEEKERWSELSSNQYQNATKVVDVAGVDSVRVRFENEGFGNKDRVFIDDISVKAMV